MSEIRQPFISFLVRRPGGQTVRKVEAFLAGQWRERWSPWENKFKPKPPLETVAREDWYDSMFRIRVDGKWLGEGYQFFTKEELALKIIEGL